MGVALDGWINPDLNRRFIGTNPSHTERSSNIDVSGKCLGSRPRIAVKDFKGAIESIDTDLVFYQIGCAGQTLWRLAGHHPNRVNLALRSSAYRIETQQRARWHDDPAPGLVHFVEKILPFQ